MNDFTKEVIRKHRRRKVALGLVVVFAGVLLLLKQTGALIPDWIFTWPMILIAIGLFKIVSERYFSTGGLMLILIGTIFLARESFNLPEDVLKFFWPIFIILIGIMIIFRPRGKRCMHKERWKQHYRDKYFQDHKFDFKHEPTPDVPGEKGGDISDVLDTVAIFCGIKRTVFSKHFRGGDTTNIFGGTEINLMQADFEGKISLDATVIFGGLKLIVPPDWDVRTDLTNIFGGFEDKRYHPAAEVNARKVLVIDGTIFFGAIEISSY